MARDAIAPQALDEHWSRIRAALALGPLDGLAEAQAMLAQLRAWSTGTAVPDGVRIQPVLEVLAQLSGVPLTTAPAVVVVDAAIAVVAQLAGESPMPGKALGKFHR